MTEQHSWSTFCSAAHWRQWIDCGWCIDTLTGGFSTISLPAIRRYGKDFSAIAEVIGTKTPAQVSILISEDLTSASQLFFICLLLPSIFSYCVLECSTTLTSITVSVSFWLGEFILRELPAQVQPGWGAEGVGSWAGGHQSRTERPQEERRGDGSSYRWSCWGGRGEAWWTRCSYKEWGTNLWVKKNLYSTTLPH